MKNKIFTLLITTLFFAFWANAQNRNLDPMLEINQSTVKAKIWPKSDVIFEDNFETDKGWTLQAPFEIGVATHEPDTAYSGTKILGGPLNVDYANDQAKVYATSPVIDCSSKSAVLLTFYSFYGFYHSVYMNMSIDAYNGTEWVEIWKSPNFIQENSWSYKEIDVTAQAAGNANFQIRYVLGAATGGPTRSGWAIDDFAVVEPAPHDLSVTEISPSGVAEGDTIHPVVTIHNYGGESEHGYNVRLIVDGTTYDKTVNVTDTVAFLEDIVVEFPGLASPGEGVYKMTAAVTVTGDADNSNDTLNTNCEVFKLTYDSGTVWAFQGSGRMTQTINKTTGNITDIGPANTNGYIKCGDAINGVVYAFLDNTVYKMLPNGSAAKFTVIDELRKIRGFAYDQMNDQMYALNERSDWHTELYKVSKEWTAELVGELPFETYFGMAADGSGNLYTIQADDSSLFMSIDKTDAHTTSIGGIGGDVAMDVRYSNDIGGDYGEKDVIYATIYDYTAHQAKFGTISTENGKFTLIAETNRSHTMCAVIPKDPVKATFTVNDGTNPIENAHVFIKNDEFLTNAAGKAEMMLTTNDWPYEIIATGFSTVTGTLTVEDDDVNITISLEAGTTEWPVTFTVKDENNNKIEGAKVELGSYTPVFTDSDGKAVFNIANGTDIPYTVSKTNYDNETGTITVNNATVDKDIVLHLTTYKVTFTVTDNHSDKVEGAKITVGDELKTTDSDGKAEFTLVIGSYEFSVSADELVYTGTTTFDVVDQDLNIAVEMDADISAASYILATDNGNAGAYIEWTMEDPTEFRHDDGTATSQLGFGSGSDNSVMGSIFNNNVLISEIKWFLTSSSGATTVNLFIFALKDDGTPDEDSIIFHVSGIETAKDEWSTYKLPSIISTPNGFYLALSYAGFLGLAIDDGVDAPYEAHAGLHYYASDYTSGEWTDMFANIPNNFLIRAVGFDKGTTTKTNLTPVNINNSKEQVTVITLDKPIVTKSSVKSLQTFDLYFMSEENKEDPSEWVTVATGIAKDVDNYTDTENWPAQETGDYVYGIIAKYDDGTSETAFSNVLSITVGINDNIKMPVNIYPNPSQGIVNINLNEHVTLEVRDITGKIIMEKNIIGNSQLQIDNAGVYFFKFTNEQGFVIKKVVVN